MRSESLVSIIVPTYNRRGFLQEAIQSCVTQTYRPIECIVVDDGSTDDTKAWITGFQKTLDEGFILKYIYQKNAGSQVARNTGTAAATGEYIQYLDSDDVLYPHKIEQQVYYFNHHPECDAVFGDWNVGTKEKSEIMISYKKENLIEQLLTEKPIAIFSILIRKTLVSRIGEWDVNIKRNQEIDFHLRGVLAGGRFDYLPGLNGLWRTHESDRIISGTGLISILGFYQKWENQLLLLGRFDDKLAKKISGLYMWFLSKNKQCPPSEAILMLREAIRLNPAIPFYQNKKLRILMKLIGKDGALKIWWLKFKTVNGEH